MEEFRYNLNKDSLTQKEKLINEFFLLNYNHIDDLNLIREELVACLEVSEDYMLRSLYYACESLIILNTTQNIEILKRHESLPKRYGSAWRNLISGICRIFA